MRSSHGNGSIRSRGMVNLAIIFLTWGVLISCGVIPVPNPSPEPTAIPVPPETGNVTIEILNGELKDVDDIVVRVLDTNDVDTKADDEKLLLQSCVSGQSITVWAAGYYIATQPCQDGTTTYNITLKPYHLNDNAYYSWVEARNAGQPRNCEPCHYGASRGIPEYTGHDEYDEWQKDGHSGVLEDSYFWTVYLGTDIYGNQGQTTPWDISNSSRHVRKIPDRSQPYFGPGFKIDYPAFNGNCAFCHAPASVPAPQTEADLGPVISAARSSQFSAATEGINCDVCHKVLNVKLDPTGKPYPDKPGVLSFDTVREEPNSQRLYVGSFSGISTGGTEINITCSPVFSESSFCAPCHYGQFWETQIYNSYGEWLISPYANSNKPDTHKTCQACHMTVNNGTPDGDRNVITAARKACSQDNTAYKDFNHNMMHRGDENPSGLIKNAAKIELNAKKVDDKFEVEVKVTNTQAGHKFPTDSPLRHLILFVDAQDQAGVVLPQISGPVIPPWGGVGTGPLDYAGKPGEIYANILMDRDTNQSPTIAYWNPTHAGWDSSDTRLKPFEPQTSKYTFAIPAYGPATIKVRLIYRYAFIDIVRQKNWDKAAYYQPDIEVIPDAVTCTVNPSDPGTWECAKASQ